MGRISLLLLSALLTSQVGAVEVETLYQQKCSECHGKERLGLMGPALLPENLKRLKQKSAVSVILNGRVATQMPPFTGQLDERQAEALVEYIYTPLDFVPTWGMEQMQASHRAFVKTSGLTDEPVHDADLLNMFVVVELGDHHATILDGDRMEPIHRFKTHFAVHGGPKYTSDGRFVYFASRDGWISKFDMWTFQTLAEVRAGINTRNIAVSADDRFVMVANYLPHTLSVLDASDLSPVRVIDIEDANGQSSRASAVYTAPPRSSFIVALKDLAEVWEIPYGETPQSIRRIDIDDYMDDFFFDQQYSKLIGAGRNARKGQVVDLDSGKKVAQLELDGMPHLASGITWKLDGRPVLATPNLRKGEVSVIDMETWKTIKRIPTMGPGFFMRSHENSRYAWVDVFFGKNRDVVHVIDKHNLKIVKTLKPAPGKTAAHVEFDRDGKYALLSIWDQQGAVVIYDAVTLEEQKRLPMLKPSGKYNVYNKITRSAGTSH